MLLISWNSLIGALSLDEVRPIVATLRAKPEPCVDRLKPE
jgi:hypothetical protein